MSIIIIVIISVFLLLLFRMFRNFIGKNDSTLLENDAKSFAKLLISEIKLYENYKVERGLKNNDLYESLRDEIEEARKKYKKRIPNSEFERYFDDALVEILAGGDKIKLGSIST